jgi:hypothetical protein
MCAYEYIGDIQRVTEAENRRTDNIIAKRRNDEEKNND